MRYELFLRGDGPLTEQRAERLLEASAAAAGAEVTVEPFHDEGGRLLGLDLSVAPDQPDATQRLCSCAFELAEGHTLRVYDPQLGHPVSPEDQPTIGQRVDATARYISAVRLGMSPEQLQAKRPGPYVWYVLAGLVLLVALLGQASKCVL